MSFTSDASALTPHVTQIRRDLRGFWAACLEKASLFRWGVTPPVLVVWALLLLMAAVHVLSRDQFLN